MDHRVAQAFQLTLGSVVAGWSSQEFPSWKLNEREGM